MWLWCSWSGNETDPVCCQTVAWRSRFSSPIPALCRKLPSFWTRHFFPTFVFPMGTLCLKSVLFHASLSSKSELRVWTLWYSPLSFQQRSHETFRHLTEAASRLTDKVLLPGYKLRGQICPGLCYQGLGFLGHRGKGKSKLLAQKLRKVRDAAASVPVVKLRESR